jgi:hypothetical protein
MADEDEYATSAQILGRFRRELIAEGFDADTVQYLVQHVGRELIIENGLSVKKEVSCDG